MTNPAVSISAEIARKLQRVVAMQAHQNARLAQIEANELIAELQKALVALEQE